MKAQILAAHLIRHKHIPVFLVVKKCLGRISVNQVPLKHRVEKTAHLMLDFKQGLAVFGVNNLLETVLVFI